MLFALIGRRGMLKRENIGSGSSYIPWLIGRSFERFFLRETPRPPGSLCSNVCAFVCTQIQMIKFPS
jgi:hypothetical protein